MPRLTRSVPKYCKHRASGQAVVTIADRDHYLGPYGNGKSKSPAASALPLTAKPISRIYKTTDFGYQTITVERPLLDEDGQVVLETRGK